MGHARALGTIALEAGGTPALCLDLGSGGGVPGLVLACDWAGSRWTLLDSNLRSIAFLGEAVTGLNLAERVKVIAGRVEEVGRDPGHRGRYGLATARAVAPAAVVAEYLAPLLAPRGIAVVSEPPGSSARWDDDGLMGLGLSLLARSTEPVAAAVLQLTAEVPERYPRRTGVARKRPLW
ncbi:MAG TPA: RsmG family class I SAM-dependent methyltransferase [Acidimicrobiales bacterium]|nr:RsmG family class I SAM-dependent methyltransferase [Acidimicrobiales bacterium]